MLNEECGESYDDIMKKVQSELDLLRSSITPENSVGNSPVDASLHATVQDCDDSLKDIRQVVGISNGESSLFCEGKRSSKDMLTSVDKEILQSYHNMKDLKSRLNGRILNEQRRLTCLQNSLDEHVEINRTLQKIHQQTKTATSATHQDHFLCDADVSNNNTQLHEDLLYITNCIDKAFSNKDGVLPTGQTHYEPLNKLILRFMKQRMDYPDQPYLDLGALKTEFHPKHIQLLQEALILESNLQNSNQMAMIDYTQNDAHKM